MTERSSHDGAPVLSSLQGRRVLVVEDEYMLAQELREGLERQGAEVIGPVPTVAEAMELLRQGPAPDIAILDINLQGEMVYPVADALRAQGIPFLFATGYEPWAIPEAYKDVPRAEKPVEMKTILLMSCH
ncbi:MAG: response regulator [Pseudomonadota bacterium]|jgi:CheY-like chemotaxis protein|nr:response regulator [Pseudomonadota bacterium]